jgi:hypothetical protein
MIKKNEELREQYEEKIRNHSSVEDQFEAFRQYVKAK